MIHNYVCGDCGDSYQQLSTAITCCAPTTPGELVAIDKRTETEYYDPSKTDTTEVEL